MIGNTSANPFAVKQGFKLPSPLPYSLDPKHKTMCCLLLHPVNIYTKAKRRLKRMF